MKADQLQPLIEAILMVADRPLNTEQLAELFEDYERPQKRLLKEVLQRLQQDYQGRGMELVEVASGWRIQARAQYASRIARLWQERPQKYSRALLETLALIAYRQPVTRGDIEEIRGVSVSSSIMKTLLEREWVRVVGYREVPGRPAMYATTRQFLDYFNLKALDQLPTLGEIRELGEQIQARQQEEIAAEEARMMAEQEAKRRQMLAQAMAEGDTDTIGTEGHDESDRPGEESELTVSELLQREYGRAEDTDLTESDADQGISITEEGDSETALSFSDLTQRLDERLGQNRLNEEDNVPVEKQDLPPIPDPDE